MTTGPEIFYAGGRVIDDATVVVMNETHKAALAAALDEDDAIMKMAGMKTSVVDRFLELLAQYPELTRPQAYMQAVMEIAEPAIKAAVEEDCAPVIVKATIGNLDGWRYCVMKVKDDDH